MGKVKRWGAKYENTEKRYRESDTVGNVRRGSSKVKKSREKLVTRHALQVVDVTTAVMQEK